MKVNIAIIRAADGETAILKGYDWDDGSEFSWADNNDSCDCNRSIYFNRARGMSNDDAYANHVECGDGGYPVEVTDEATGALIFKG